jgi:hypothetical protein
VIGQRREDGRPVETTAERQERCDRKHGMRLPRQRETYVGDALHEQREHHESSSADSVGEASRNGGHRERRDAGGANDQSEQLERQVGEVHEEHERERKEQAAGNREH